MIFFGIVQFDYIMEKQMNFIDSNEMNFIKFNFFENYNSENKKNEIILFNKHLYYKNGQTMTKVKLKDSYSRIWGSLVIFYNKDEFY